MKELVSIVIPIYNVEGYIVECLQSVAQQEYPYLEVILVDDCGQDDSVKLAEQFISSEDLDWAIIRHEKNKGLSCARNTGLKVAQGSYVFFLDSDDKLNPSCISKLVSQLSLYPYDVVVGGYEILGSENNVTEHYLCEGDYRENSSVIEAYSKGLWYVMAWNKLCNREFLLNNGLFFEEGILHEDVVWSFKLASAARSLRSIVDYTYGYRIRPESIMTSFSIERDAKAYAKVFNILNMFMTEKGHSLSPAEYTIFEGKKSTLLFSLLRKGQNELFRELYKEMRENAIIKPYEGYKAGIITKKQLIRDIHYALPTKLGAFYKTLFYSIVYKWPHRNLEGVIWQ